MVLLHKTRLICVKINVRSGGICNSIYKKIKQLNEVKGNKYIIEESMKKNTKIIIIVIIAVVAVLNVAFIFRSIWIVNMELYDCGNRGL